MKNSNVVETIINDTENIMNDIFLSGFHTVQPATFEKLEQIENLCRKTGMDRAGELISDLKNELNKRRNSFEYDVKIATDIFCKLEFYIQNAKDNSNFFYKHSYKKNFFKNINIKVVNLKKKRK